MYTVTVVNAVGGDIWPQIQTNTTKFDSEIFFQASNGFYISLINIVDGGTFTPATNLPVSAPDIATNIQISATFTTNSTDGSISNNVPEEWMQKMHGIYTTNYVAAATNDYDLDGYSTADEFLMSSDPTDSNDFLRISSLTLDGSGNPIVKWITDYDDDFQLPPFRIDVTTNISASGSWASDQHLNKNRYRRAVYKHNHIG